ncbi:MAG: hypothetical protein K6T83_03580 [Alicyclobacillus sp.]|nr:hypothetical protein [Alicyclobacillus sp.]
MAKRQQNATSELDAIVRERIMQAQAGQQVRKSVVTAPSDPNGGGRLPRKQENAARQKVKGDTQYPAVFDREAEESNEQLDEWLDETQEAIESPDDFVEDARNDEPGADPDEEDWEDNEDDIYDPFGDDDEFDQDDLESLELPDDEAPVTTRRRRTVRKANEAEDFLATEDDDELGESGRKKTSTKRTNDDEEEDEERRKKEARRRKEVRKALGADAMRFVDGSELVKALTDAVWDMRDAMVTEVRALRMENRRLHREQQKLQKALAALTKRENRELAKSLTNAQLMIAGYEIPEEVVETPPARPQRQAQPIRKGYGQPIQTTKPAVGAPVTDLQKAFDVLEEAYQKSYTEGGENPDFLNAITMLENDGAGAIQFLPASAQELLRQNGIIR